jgi:antitoxin ParD1/3/4
MASMNISLPHPMRDYVQDRIDSGHYASASDYVRDLIRRDQSGIKDEQVWLRELDSSIEETLAEMHASGGTDLDDACDAALLKLKTVEGPPRA